MSNATLSWPNIDALLGPGDERFFGRGYRGVRYGYGPVVVEGDSPSTGLLLARLSTGYPSNWSSKKADEKLAPHLSTVDAVIVGTELAELLLTHAFNLDPSQRRRAWVRRLDIKAASSPQEDLRDLPLEAALLDSAVLEDADELTVSTVRCLIGSMTVTAQVQHPTAALQWQATRMKHPDALLGPAGRRYHGRVFASRGQRVTDVALDLQALTARASVELTSERGSTTIPTEGFGVSHFPAPTMVDAFVVNLQLAQALLYQLDGGDRTNSNTLWMRSTQLVADVHKSRNSGAYVVTVALENARTVPVGGQIWRISDIVGELGGVHLRCALAHQLPSS
ncbi:MAG: hypothetical protein DLM61_02855 [Pseudonocardiales bacterium]|nr:MAG: hypothetical protein DLM61_02855 [Pseudonocardiales bacterium]